jgi:hypothetical protein
MVAWVYTRPFIGTDWHAVEIASRLPIFLSRFIVSKPLGVTNFADF